MGIKKFKMRELKSELCDYAKKIALSESMVDESHFYDFRQNIFGGKMKPKFIKMFMDCDGNELVSKACAVHSSSMLGYNFFHWISEEQPFTYEGIQYTKVLFEVKIRYLAVLDNGLCNVEVKCVINALSCTLVALCR